MRITENLTGLSGLDRLGYWVIPLVQVNEMPIHNTLPRSRISRQRSSYRRPPEIRRPLIVERLEDRNMLSSIPFGAAPGDTAEYMLGDVLVTLVLMESDGTVDASTEDWTEANTEPIRQKVLDALNWWEESLALEDSVHSLNFILDNTYVDSPVPTRYEPISRPWDDFVLWVEDFLEHVGFSTAASLGEDIRAFNHAQRLAHNTDWSFIIFAANSTNDGNGRFELGHEFSGAFSFAGGLFVVTPSERSVRTLAHETGHMFYALDEYPGGSSYFNTRGYYGTQNLNAWDGNPDQSSRVNSIMSSGSEAQNAYNNHLISPSIKEMIGWKDSDGDGVFDVLDLPHTFHGSGAFDPHIQAYRFLGESSVQTLPNLNPSGLRNDITINQISRAEYRIDGGLWQTAAEFHTASAQLDLTIPVADGAQQIEIRTIDDDSGVTSVVFSATIGRPESTVLPGINGFAWVDVDQDGVREVGEPGLSNWTISVKQSDGTPLPNPQAAKTDALGAFSFIGLGPGTYLVELETRQGWTNVAPQDGQAVVALNENGLITGVDFGVFATSTESMWQNPRNAMDVDDDGIVTLTDIFVVANDLYFNFARMLPAPTVTPNAPQPYIDTDGDGWVSFVDALLVAHEWRSIVGETEAAVAQMNSPATGLEQNERSAVVLEALDVASAPGTSSPLETAEIAEPDGVQSNGLGPFWILQAVDAERGPSNRVSRTATGRLEQPESKASAESLVNVESIPNSWSTAVSREIDYAPLTVSSGLPEPTDANVGTDSVFALLADRSRLERFLETSLGRVIA